MNPKIEKLEKEIDKTKAKIAEMQGKLRKLEEQKTELENTDYVAVGPDGVMLTNTMTPDGYRVGADGVWIQ